MRGFTSPRHAQQFLSAHARIGNLFRMRHRHTTAADYRVARRQVCDAWKEATCAPHVALEHVPRSVTPTLVRREEPLRDVIDNVTVPPKQLHYACCLSARLSAGVKAPRAEDRFTAVRSRCRTSALGRSANVSIRPKTVVHGVDLRSIEATAVIELLRTCPERKVER